MTRPVLRPTVNCHAIPPVCNEIALLQLSTVNQCSCMVACCSRRPDNAYHVPIVNRTCIYTRAPSDTANNAYDSNSCQADATTSCWMLSCTLLENVIQLRSDIWGSGEIHCRTVNITTVHICFVLYQRR